MFKFAEMPGFFKQRKKQIQQSQNPQVQSPLGCLQDASVEVYPKSIFSSFYNNVKFVAEAFLMCCFVVGNKGE